VIVDIIRRKPVLTNASIACGGLLASVNSVKMGDRMATIDMGRKVGAAVPLSVGVGRAGSSTPHLTQ